VMGRGFLFSASFAYLQAQIDGLGEGPMLRAAFDQAAVEVQGAWRSAYHYFWQPGHWVTAPLVLLRWFYLSMVLPCLLVLTPVMFLPVLLVGLLRPATATRPVVQRLPRVRGVMRLRPMQLRTVLIILLVIFAWFVWPTPYRDLSRYEHINRFTGAVCALSEMCWWR